MRVSSTTHRYEKADPDTLSEVPQVVKDLDVLRGLPVAAPPILIHFGLTPLVTVGDTGALFSSMLAMNGFSTSLKYLFEAVSSQCAWVLSSAKAAAAKPHWSRFFDLALADGVTKAFPKRLLMGAGLVDLLGRAMTVPLERRVPRVSRTMRRRTPLFGP